MSAHEWVERQLSRETPLPAFPAAAIDLLCNALGVGPWNVPVRWDRASLTERRCRFVLRTDGLATFDSDPLTRLVVLAHDRCIRLQLSPAAFAYLAIEMWPRKRNGGDFSAHHPTIEEAIARLRPAPIEEAA